MSGVQFDNIYYCGAQYILSWGTKYTIVNYGIYFRRPRVVF